MKLLFLVSNILLKLYTKSSWNEWWHCYVWRVDVNGVDQSWQLMGWAGPTFNRQLHSYGYVRHAAAVYSRFWNRGVGVITVRQRAIHGRKWCWARVMHSISLKSSWSVRVLNGIKPFFLRTRSSFHKVYIKDDMVSTCTLSPSLLGVMVRKVPQRTCLSLGTIVIVEGGKCDELVNVWTRYAIGEKVRTEKGRYAIEKTRAVKQIKQKLIIIDMWRAE